MINAMKWLAMLLKNTLAFLAGGVSGVLVAVLFAEPLIRRSVSEDVGLGIIAVAPVVLILYSILFGAVGGVSGIIIYNIIRARRRK